MKKVLINFEMNSLDSKVKFTTTGECDNKRIIFKDNELSSHVILFIDNTIEYHKKGLMDMLFIFNPKKKTKGTYEVNNNILEFDIITSKLEYNDNRLIIKYDLIQNNEIVNRSTLTIMYSITQEE
jgi:uncharacterized beta-barrel protein YwiB (DUF1934 family)